MINPFKKFPYIKWWMRPLFWFRRTHTIINEGFILTYKRNGKGIVYIMDWRKL